MTAAFGLGLLAILAVVAWIDWRTFIIPDTLNLCLAATGCLFQLTSSPADWLLHICVGASVFAVFWLVRHMHATATGRIGLGLGDVKMAGAAAVWISPWHLPAFVFVASLSALAVLLTRELVGVGGAVHQRQPFGPFLALALSLVWIGEQWVGPSGGWLAP